MQEFSKISKLVLDTSVIVEYIIINSSIRHIVEKLLNGDFGLTLYVSPITLSETLYIAERVYRIAGVPNSNERALEFVTWLKSKVKLIDLDEFVWITAGELKKRYRISIADAYAIASAKKIGAKVLFKKVEKEMEKFKKDLLREGVIFLEEISLSKNLKE